MAFIVTNVAHIWVVVLLLCSRRFLVVNLCSERSYDPVIFEREGGVVLQLGFDDHNPPPLEMMQPFCHTVGSFLKEDPERVAAIHCKAGKGRTGTMIACLLLYLNEFCTADDALRWFGYCRTSNGKGVTIPSQARYVHYFEQLLYPKVAKQLLKVVPTVVRRQTAWLHSIHVHTVPHFDPDGGCDLYFEVKQRVEPNHRSARDYGVVPRHKKGLKNPEIWFELTPPMELTGDVKLVFYDKDMASSEKVCCCWLHVGMEPGNEARCPVYCLSAIAAFFVRVLVTAAVHGLCCRHGCNHKIRDGWRSKGQTLQAL